MILRAIALVINKRLKDMRIVTCIFNTVELLWVSGHCFIMRTQISGGSISLMWKKETAMGMSVALADVAMKHREQAFHKNSCKRLNPLSTPPSVANKHTGILTL